MVQTFFLFFVDTKIKNLTFFHHIQSVSIWHQRWFFFSLANFHFPSKLNQIHQNELRSILSFHSVMHLTLFKSSSSSSSSHSFEVHAKDFLLQLISEGVEPSAQCFEVAASFFAFGPGNGEQNVQCYEWCYAVISQGNT